MGRRTEQDDRRGRQQSQGYDASAVCCHEPALKEYNSILMILRTVVGRLGCRVYRAGSSSYVALIPIFQCFDIAKQQQQQQQQQQLAVFSTHRPDPLAKRPNQKCDPYGQGGKPLSYEDAKRLLTTIDNSWVLESSPTNVENEDRSQSSIPPQAITREFYHTDFWTGSQFLTHVAAVAQMNDHYPSLHLERRLLSKEKAWQVVSTVRCHTRVLQGLSHHDFFVATVSQEKQ